MKLANEIIWTEWRQGWLSNLIQWLPVCCNEASNKGRFASVGGSCRWMNKAIQDSWCMLCFNWQWTYHFHAVTWWPHWSSHRVQTTLNIRYGWTQLLAANNKKTVSKREGMECFKALLLIGASYGSGAVLINDHQCCDCLDSAGPNLSTTVSIHVN